MGTANRKPLAQTPLSRGMVATRAGCNIETVRYYEQVGLLPAPPRSEGGHRLYQDGLVRRLLFIRRARALGFTLDEIRGLLRLVDGGLYTCAQVEQLALAQIGEIGRKIADLQKLAAALQTMAAQCSGGDVPECPIIDALFAAPDAPVMPQTPLAPDVSRRGQGPRRTRVSSPP